MILAIPLKNTPAPEMVDPLLQNGKGDEVEQGGGEVERVV